MMIKKAAVCAFVFLVILAAAIVTNLRTQSAYLQENPSNGVYHMQHSQGGAPFFSPREYVKIIRHSPETLPDQP
ncbi:hypothetical protein JNUCC32_06565 [Paenibacillus sp. JNUCC32]|uniref:hypothetical protein n=1 Tax=Paenibacillus sp. JNUCC32 TaxID=2777984 RepID=UPI001787949A|nr:hypothetical protein [Paenibacillus sp. JNUCC-32]QOT11687.1 hypothetical protein JNUCC32_06565 [Paenibacillus sp. JNUCC-32]